MKCFLSILLLSIAASGQSLAVSHFALPDAHRQRHFWTVENKASIGVLAGLVAADAITTQRGLNQGSREVNPVMRPFVTRGASGEAVGSALGFGAGMGFVYLLHRSRHFTAARVAMRVIVVGEGGFVANNVVAIR